MLTLLKQFAAKLNPNDVNVPRVGANTIFDQVLTTVYYVAGIVAVIVIIVAGIVYVTAQGDSGKIRTGKNAILGAVAGLVVVLAAFIITQYVLGKL